MLDRPALSTGIGSFQYTAATGAVIVREAGLAGLRLGTAAHDGVDWTKAALCSVA